MPFGRFVACFVLLLTSQCGIIGSVRAQFWAALPQLKSGRGVSLCFSQDEKFVFYLDHTAGHTDTAGVSNIFRVSIKGGQPTQITKFTEGSVVRVFHSLGSRQLIFMRAKSHSDTDYHLYSIKDDGTGEINDLTPTGSGVQNTMIGESYNGHYIYYTANKESLTKLDCYRYDVEQYVSELVFPNDKDYKVLAWSRDNDKLLVEDPGTETLSLFNVETTEFRKLTQPAAGAHYLEALLTPDNLKLGVLESTGGSIEEKWTDVGSSSWNTAVTDASHIDFSTNGKFEITSAEKRAQTVADVSTKQVVIASSIGAWELAVAPREDLIVFLWSNGGGVLPIFRIKLYDVAKKTTIDLVNLTQ